MVNSRAWNLESEGRIIHRFSKDGKEHVIILDMDGKEIIDLTDKYDDCDLVFSCGRMIVSTNKFEGSEIIGGKLSGYIDLDGNEIISPQFYNANRERFLCGRAAVGKCDWRRMKSEDNKLIPKNERYGIIDENGNTIVPFIYEDISILYGYMCSCCKHKVKEKIKNPADLFYIVRETGKEGIMNGNGEWILKPKFEKHSILEDEDGELIFRKCLMVQTEGLFYKNKYKHRIGIYSIEKDDWFIEPMKLGQLWYDPSHYLTQIFLWTIATPKFDKYTVNIKAGSKRKYKRDFENFCDAYKWGKKIYASAASEERMMGWFCIEGRKNERKKMTENEFLAWLRSPFNRSDCESIVWDFDKYADLESRSYCYNYVHDVFGGEWEECIEKLDYEYMPDDENEDAGTHFKKGDFVRVWRRDEYKKDSVWVVFIVPGKKNINNWENVYALVEVIEKDGKFYTNHEHFHESKLLKYYDDEMEKNSPLRYVQKVFSGETELKTKEETDMIADAELVLENGEWKVKQ